MFILCNHSCCCLLNHENGLNYLGSSVPRSSTGERGEDRVRGCNEEGHFRIRIIQRTEDSGYEGYHDELRQFAGEEILKEEIGKNKGKNKGKKGRKEVRK